MAENRILTQISTQVLRFKPGKSPTTFEVEVVNQSDQFATFQLEIHAPGGDEIPGARWYRLSPDISTKKPPGDVTQFVVTLVDAPIPGFVGTMTLTVRVFSLELGEEKREVLRLVVEGGTRLIPPIVELPVQSFQSLPGDLVEMPVSVSHTIQQGNEISIKLRGLDPDWLVSGMEQQLKLDANGEAETSFLCQLPITTQTLSKIYPFTIEAAYKGGPPGQAQGTLEILPQGFINFDCAPIQTQIPEQKRGFQGWGADFAAYRLQFENESNLPQQVSIQIRSKDQQRCTFQIFPDRTVLAPGKTVQLQLGVRSRRRWWGWIRRLTFEVKAVISDPRLDIRNDTQLLKLSVLPLMRFWMQILAALLLLVLLWWASWLNPNNLFWGHQGPVTSVQFNGMANQIATGSNDKTVRRWEVDGFFNPFVHQEIGIVGTSGKAVRVVRYKPVANDWAAAGLENGEIRIWNLLRKRQTPRAFSYQRDDRVLDLAFSQGSSYLFSGHGSGWVLQWDIASDRLNANLKTSIKASNQTEAVSLVNQRKVDFAVYALALAGKRGQNLAIGGRFNQLMVWNWLQDSLRPLPYPYKGGQGDYLTSLDTALYQPYLLATGDTQGYITLWDLRQCLDEQEGICTPVDQWRQGHDGKPVRSVALSEDGCYLASGGDDGQVMLWPLTAGGKRNLDFFDGQLMSRSVGRKRFNSVDVKVVQRKVVKQEVLVTSGSDDTQVRVNWFFPPTSLKCDRNN